MNVTRGALALVLAVFAPVGASAQTRCTQETLNVRGTPVAVGYCVGDTPHATAGGELLVPVNATYGAPGGSFTKTGDLRFVAGERVSRVLESVDLNRIGVAGTLHLTLTYSGGLVRIEGAMLTPGAITIK